MYGHPHYVNEWIRQHSIAYRRALWRELRLCGYVIACQVAIAYGLVRYFSP